MTPYTRKETAFLRNDHVKLLHTAVTIKVTHFSDPCPTILLELTECVFGVASRFSCSGAVRLGIP